MHQRITATRETKDKFFGTATIRALEEVPSAEAFVFHSVGLMLYWHIDRTVWVP